MKPRVARYMDRRGDEEEEGLHPAAIRPMERGEAIRAVREEEGRRDEASKEGADGGPAEAGNGAKSSSAPAIEAAARAQRVKAVTGSGIEVGDAGGSGVQRDGGEHHKDGHTSPFNKFINKRVSKFFESRRQQGHGSGK